MTLTARHHDGLALWDSHVSNYDLGDYTNLKRDIVKELAEACKKHGLKMGLYYSHWVDWEHEYGWDHNKELTGITSEQYDRGFLFTPKNQDSIGPNVQIQKKAQYGTVPEHVIIKKYQSFRWKIYVDEPGEKQVDVSYSFQSQTANSHFVVKTAASEIKLAVRNTGKTVGEPNQNRIIDNFKSESAGKILFPKAGFYEVVMDAIPANNEELKFQWIWIN